MENLWRHKPSTFHARILEVGNSRITFSRKDRQDIQLATPYHLEEFHW